jgi:hypothetical protein
VPRLTSPRRSDFDDPEDLEAYDAVVRRRSSMGEAATGEDQDRPDLGEYWNGLINSPRLCALAAQAGTFFRTAGERSDTYSHADREFVDQVLSADMKTNIVQRVHIPDGLAAGVRLEAVEAIRDGREDALTEDEQLLARYIRQVINGSVNDATFAAMRERLGDRGAIEYAGFALWLFWIMRMMQLVEIEDPSPQDIDALIAGLKDGSIDLPDFQQRIG